MIQDPRLNGDGLLPAGALKVGDHIRTERAMSGTLRVVAVDRDPRLKGYLRVVVHLRGDPRHAAIVRVPRSFTYHLVGADHE